MIVVGIDREDKSTKIGQGETHVVGSKIHRTDVSQPLTPNRPLLSRRSDTRESETCVFARFLLPLLQYDNLETCSRCNKKNPISDLG